MRVAILGLSVTSSWGNGHATNFRALMRALEQRGHDVTFLERDVPWYARHRDLPHPPWGQTFLYRSLDELVSEHARVVERSDLAIVGSFVPEGVAVGDWVTRSAGGATAFFDIDTPVTLEKLEQGDDEYLVPDLVPRYDLYLSFTGGPTLDRLEREFGSPRAVAFYCVVDESEYFPEAVDPQWDLGYLGTFSDDRQPTLQRMMLDAAVADDGLAFVVAGPGYPETIRWPANVHRIDHLPPERHRGFYNAQRFTLNVTRRQMVAAGYSPSVRLFEAAACAVPIVSDRWPGLDTFFEIGREILVAGSARDVLGYLRDMDEGERRSIGLRARERVLREHTAATRVAELERHLQLAGTAS